MSELNAITEDKQQPLFQCMGKAVNHTFLCSGLRVGSDAHLENHGTPSLFVGKRGAHMGSSGPTPVLSRTL